MVDIRITSDTIGIHNAWVVTEHEDVIVWMANVPRMTELTGVSGGIVILSNGDKFAEIGIAGLDRWTTFAEVSRCALMACSVKESDG